ncbi:hypothetical protein PM082_017756 [Marasmius tenuissimus]|nr:hypothetical protein PM082_017756 [Marasmius tenuissimus]
MSQDSQVYCRALYPLGNGLALWGPEPNADLPLEYRTSGIRVGDIGLVTSDGRFDFLFNVCLPKNHPINLYNGVPEGYEPLAWDGRCFRTERWFHPQRPICSTNSEEYALDIEANVSLFGLPVGGGGGIGVMFSRERGAAVMPGIDGADRTDASNKSAFSEYAFRHGESWYRFANETLGREASNGELYLITGFDKSNSWENAVIYNRSNANSYTLAFTTAGLGPEERLKLSKTTSVRARFGSRTKVVSTYKAPQGEILDTLGGIPFGGSCGSSGSVASSSRYPAASSPSMNDTSSSDSSGPWDEESDTSWDEDFIPELNIHHPLVAINDYILKSREDATLVVTHDDDWISLLDDNHDSVDIPDDSTLIARLNSKMTVIVKHGGHATIVKSVGSLDEPNASTVPWPNNHVIGNLTLPGAKFLSHTSAGVGTTSDYHCEHCNKNAANCSCLLDPPIDQPEQASSNPALLYPLPSPSIIPLSNVASPVLGEPLTLEPIPSQEDEDTPEELSPNATDQQRVEHQRRRNTLAARQSRKKKALYRQELDHTIERLQVEADAWRNGAELLHRIMQSEGLGSKCPEWPDIVRFYNRR